MAWLETVLPHETTHVVLAGQFGTGLRASAVVALRSFTENIREIEAERGFTFDRFMATRSTSGVGYLVEFERRLSVSELSEMSNALSVKR